MEKEELQELFCIKIGLEKERFKRRMLKQEPEEIFYRCVPDRHHDKHL